MVGALQSLIGAGACVLALAVLSFAARWVQVLVLGAVIALGGWLVARGVVELDGGAALAGFMLMALAWGLNAILTDIRRANAAALSPSCEAPGAPLGAGDAGKRDGERYAPSSRDGVSTTAGCAGRPRAFSEGVR